MFPTTSESAHVVVAESGEMVLVGCIYNFLLKSKRGMFGAVDGCEKCRWRKRWKERVWGLGLILGTTEGVISQFL
ncbi:hypothetical protein HanOQP8_Chr11g0387711 [Helianthus annuus]|nr:hypothetical protein HanIR_Chr11g0505231 [Helianthus annuus]KAJ0515848.1 hypothetical protein HanHA89_Chr11g0407351 [Helianthus annuus]KAJ0687828.1 hypothetical protein HanOQP8_Chr11g0387711 [Helianthus annuus]